MNPLRNRRYAHRVPVTRINRRWRCWCVGWLVAGCVAGGAVAAAPPDEMRQWLRENLDPEVLAAFGEVDEELLAKCCRALQEQFQGDYVIDLAALRQGAAALVPVLEAHTETKPYAAWLKLRLDYLEVADELRLSIPPPRAEPGQPVAPVPNPEPAVQRRVWQQHVAHRSLPANAAKYVARLKPVFVAQQVPPELVWVAEVESAFDPRAQSPVGAAGLFQLMPVTATQQGLRLHPADERLEPEKSAAAAAKYLRYLYGRFHDWRLALAAYNAGETRVRGLLARQPGKTFDAIAVRLPAETQMYVPKIEAVILRREGVGLAKLTGPGMGP